MRKVFKHVRADYKIEFSVRIDAPDLLKRIRSVALALPFKLIIAGKEAVLAHKRRFCKAQPHIRIHAKGDAFMRRLRRHHKKHLIKREALPGFARDINMSFVRGIEAAPKYSDLH